MKNRTYNLLITAGLFTVIFFFTSELIAMQAAPAEISISQGSLAFPNIAVGATADEKTFTIENTGDETLNITVQLVGPQASQYAITSGGGSYSIPGSTTSDVSVVFSPTSIGSKNADVRIDHDATNLGSPQTVTLSGTGAPAILYVDQLATGTETGLSWTDAFIDLQDALAMAAEGASIWVAAGTYKPTSGNDTTVSFTISRDIEVYGGFSGSETKLGQRDWAANPTVLSGNIGDPSVDDDNSVHVLWIENVSSSARIDGFTISGGYAGDSNTDDTSNFFDIGGGILCEGSSGKTCNPILANLIISNNHAERGGGLFNNGVLGTSNPTLMNVILRNNSTPTPMTVTTTGGAGMYNNGANGESSPILNNVTLYGNVAGNNGGAISNAGHAGGISSTSLTNVILWGNTADVGSQIANFDAVPTLTNCVIEGGLGGIFENGTSSTTDGGGNMSSNPLLESAADLRLQPFSPAIDAGTADTSGLGLPATDLNGSVRVKGTIDIGAYESGLHLNVPGSEGWRMMAAPLAAQSYAELLDSLWTQGLTGADETSGTANIYTWNEATSSWQAPADMSNTPGTGTGFTTYVFSDDDFDGTPEGFPKQLSVTGSEPSGPVDVGVSSTDENSGGTIDANEGWNLLGNPFGTPILVDEILSAAAAVDASINTNVYVWDHGSGSYSIFPQGGGHAIAPWQSFWIRYTATGVSGNLSLDRTAAKTDSAAFQKVLSPLAGLTLTLSGAGALSSTFQVIPNPDSEIGPDRWDAYRPAPLSTEYISLYTIDKEVALAHSHLPVQLDEPVSLPLAVDAAGTIEKSHLTLSWTPKELPSVWNLELRDNRNGRIIKLDRDGSYSFELARNTSKLDTGEIGMMKPSGPDLHGEEATTRFTLTVSPYGSILSSTSVPRRVELTQNYPNPFNPETVIRYGVPERGWVQLGVFDMLGRKVGTLVDRSQSPGRYEVDFDASGLASGLYLYRLEIGGKVLTRKMMLIK